MHFIDRVFIPTCEKNQILGLFFLSNEEDFMNSSQPANTTTTAPVTATPIQREGIPTSQVLSEGGQSETTHILLTLADKIHYVAIGIFTFAAFVCSPLLTLLSLAGGYWAANKRFQILPSETIVDPEKQLFATPEKRLLTLFISIFVLPIISSPLSIIALGLLAGRYVKNLEGSFSLTPAIVNSQSREPTSAVH
jgi:hypothetical protein